jgi:predicted esterase
MQGGGVNTAQQSSAKQEGRREGARWRSLRNPEDKRARAHRGTPRTNSSSGPRYAICEKMSQVRPRVAPPRAPPARGRRTKDELERGVVLALSGCRAASSRTMAEKGRWLVTPTRAVRAGTTLGSISDAQDSLRILASKMPEGRERAADRCAAKVLVMLALMSCKGGLGRLESENNRDSGGGAGLSAIDGEDGGGGGQDSAQSGSPGGAGGSGSVGVVGWTPVETDWCARGWTGLDDHTCFHVPEKVIDGMPLIVVLHGAMSSDTSPAPLQLAAQEAADALGFVALFPRGRQGLCTWDLAVEDYYCWPTRRVQVDAEASALLEEMVSAEALLQQILGITFGRRYIMGFSNGGYFASYIGLERLIDVDGVGLVGAGRSIIEEEQFSQFQAPFYIAVGAQETAPVIASAYNLHVVLTGHGWPHEFVVHVDRGHEIHTDDFTSAWQTWGGWSGPRQLR